MFIFYWDIFFNIISLILIFIYSFIYLFLLRVDLLKLAILKTFRKWFVFIYLYPTGPHTVCSVILIASKTILEIFFCHFIIIIIKSCWQHKVPRLFLAVRPYRPYRSSGLLPVFAQNWYKSSLVGQHNHVHV